MCSPVELQEDEEHEDDDKEDQEEDLGHSEGDSITKVEVYSVKVVILSVLIS